MAAHSKSSIEINDDKLEEGTTTAVENLASETNSAVPRSGVTDELTLRRVFRDHPALVWWSFYWAMAGVAW